MHVFFSPVFAGMFLRLYPMSYCFQRLWMDYDALNTWHKFGEERLIWAHDLRDPYSRHAGPVTK